MISFQSIYNRIDANFHLSNKKALFYNMRIFYTAIGEPYERTLPLTFHCEKGTQDPIFKDFLSFFEKAEVESKEAVI
jgi:tubulin--tyrosine ligase